MEATGVAPPATEPETTEFLLPFRVTREQLEIIEWGTKHARSKDAQKRKFEKPEELMAFMMLPEFARQLEMIRAARVSGEGT